MEFMVVCWNCEQKVRMNGEGVRKPEIEGCGRGFWREGNGVVVRIEEVKGCEEV